MSAVPKDVTALASSNQVPNEGRPSLQREIKSKDGEISHVNASSKELKLHRFGLDIKSVHYYAGKNGGTCCAILLTTTFQLRGSKLAYASVPLGVRTDLTAPQANDPVVASSSTISLPHDPRSTLELASYHPSKHQRRVKQVHVTERREINPTFKATSPVIGIEGSGYKHEREVVGDAAQAITLHPERDAKPSDQTIPDVVNWIYTSPEKLDYPPNTDLIVIAEKSKYIKPWFAFTLHIRSELFVDMHGSPEWYKSVVRFIAKSPPKEGWVFKIKGEYYPEKVQAILEGGKNVDTLVGLEVEPGQWEL